MSQQRFQFVSPEAQRIRSGRTQEQQVRGTSELRGGVMGGGVQAPRPTRGGITQRADVDDSTLNAFRALSDAIIDPMIEQRQQEEYLEGARRQIEGEALQDIVSSQPWYSRIFGPSASVQGARTMAQMQAVENFASEMERDMGTLRALSPEEFGVEVNNRIRASSELGDSRTDVAVQAKLMESYGPLVRSHTKAHYAYVQETMQTEFTNSLATGARSLSQYMQGVQRGTVSPDDARIILQNTEASLYPLDGQTPDSYWSSIETATEEAMALGNFHFVNLVQDRLYEHMPAEQRVKFQNDRRKYEIQAAADQAAGPMALEIAQLKAYSAEGMLSPDETWSRIGKLNAAFRATTGIDRDMLDASAAEGIITNNLRGIIQEQRKAREAAASRADKDRELEREALFAQMMFSSGAGSQYSEQGGDRALLQSAALATVNQLRTLEGEGMVEPGSWAQVVTTGYNKGDTIVSALQSEIRAGARNSVGNGINPSFRNAYSLYRDIRNAPEGGISAAAAYAGEYADKFETFHRYIDSGTMDEDVAFTMTFNDLPTRSPRNQELTQEVMSYLSDVTDPGVFSRIFGAPEPLTGASRRVVANITADAMANLETATTGLDTASKVELAWGVGKSGVEIVGNHAIYGNGGTRLNNFLGKTPEETGRVFQTQISRQLRASGIDYDPDSYTLQRMPDQVTQEGHVPRYIMVTGSGSIFIDGNDLRKVSDELTRRGLTPEPITPNASMTDAPQPNQIFN